MTMTTEPAATVLILDCEYCREQTMIRPQGARLELLTNGLMLLRFFCLHCYELNIAKLVDAGFAEQVSAMGVPTTLVRVPLEVGEHPHSDLPPISAFQVEKWERLPLKGLHMAIEQELP